MQENKRRDLFARIIVTIGTLIAYMFINKKLKEHNLRFPTIGEYLAFAFIFSIAAWIIIIVGAVVIKIISFFIGLF